MGDEISRAIELESSSPKRYKRKPFSEEMTRELEDIYTMYDQSINVSKIQFQKTQSQIKSSKLSSIKNQNKIKNVESILNQLLESFKVFQKYIWGESIFNKFKKHFMLNFQEIWLFTKEEFYQLLLRNCQFDTLKIQKEYERILGYHSQISSHDDYRSYFQKYFYEHGAGRIEQKIPESFIEEDVTWQESFRSVQDYEPDIYSINAINSSIIEEEKGPNKIEKKKLKTDDGDDQFDFLPLCVKKKHEKKIKIKSQHSYMVESDQKVLKRNTEYNNSTMGIQNSSIIMPETVFIDRMSIATKMEITDLIKFYRQFSNTLQQMFYSCSIISCPLKHFLLSLRQKMLKKKIKGRNGSSIVKAEDSASKSSKSEDKEIFQQTLPEKMGLLLSDSEEGNSLRRKRQTNNNLLLSEVKDFTEAYTEFIWKYLELYEIGESKLGRLITIDALYGIVLKNVWKFVEWIGERGYQYEDFKLIQIINQSTFQSKVVSNKAIDQQKKSHLYSVLNSLKEEKNPQKYLKKIVIFYREVSKCCETADDLLNIYQELFTKSIKSGASKQLRLFRMKNIIEKLLKIDENISSGGGEISYSWTTWCIMIEHFKGQILDYKFKGESEKGNGKKMNEQEQQIELETVYSPEKSQTFSQASTLRQKSPNSNHKL